MKDQIESLAKKAAAAATSVEALQFSQAACNLANALSALKSAEGAK